MEDMTLAQESSLQLLAVWSNLSRVGKLDSLCGLHRVDADDLFLRLDTRDQAELMRLMPEPERRLWMRLLPPDDVADLIQCIPVAERARFLVQLDEATRHQVTALLAYAEDAAGGLMNPRFARLRPDISVDEAIAYLSRQAGHVDIIDYGYVLDAEQHLLGLVSLRDLFSADRDRLVLDVISFKAIAARSDLWSDRDNSLCVLPSKGMALHVSRDCSSLRGPPGDS